MSFFKKIFSKEKKETLDKGLEKTKTTFLDKLGKAVAGKSKVDEDVLDTWFSSWLWPISVFDGWRDTKELDYYYPTNVLVTGWDIIFLWVP